MSRTDHRTRVTRMLIRRAFAELMRRKPIQDITIKELCGQAGINRGTFYLHYKDIYDLVDQIEKELFDEFERILSNYTISDLGTRPHKIFSDVCSFLYANREICAALLGDNGDINFLLNLREFLRQKCLHDIIETYHIDRIPDYEYVYAYFESGTVGVLRYWLDHPEDGKTPDEIASMIESIFTYGASLFKKDAEGRNGG